MKQLFFSLLAVAAMASCSKSELSMRPEIETGDVEIMATTDAKSIDATTRAPFEGAIAADNELKARVFTTNAEGGKKFDSANLYADGTMTFSSVKTDDAPNNKPYDATGFTGSIFYPANGSTIYLCGLYPADLTLENVKYSGDNDLTYGTATISGIEDFMLAPEVSSTKEDALKKIYPNLAFKHMLTKLTIKVKAENEAAKNAWGEIEKITVKEVNSKIQVNLGEAKTYAASSPSAYSNPIEFSTYIIDQTTQKATDDAFDAQSYELKFDVPANGDVEAVTVDPVAIAYSLVCPVEVKTVNVDAATKHIATYTLLVKTKNIEDAYEIEVKLNQKAETDGVTYAASTEGYAYDVNLTFKATVIEATATVEDWKDGGSGEETIE